MNQRDPHQVDDFVRRKLARRQHQPPPGAWEEAERLLQAEEGRHRKRPGWLWWGLLGLLLLSGGAWAWWADWRTDTASSSVSSSRLAAHPPAAPTDFPVVSAAPCPPTSEAKGGAGAVPPSAGNPSRSGWVMRGPRPSPQAAASLAAMPSSPPGEASVADATSTDATSTDSPRGDLSKLYALSRRGYILGVDWPPSTARPQSLPLPQRARRWGWYLEAGSGLSRSWQHVEAISPTWTAMPHLGAGLRYTLRPGWTLLAGLRYHNRGGLDSDSSYLRQELGFGRRDTFTTVEPLRLHFVGLPLRLDIHLAGRHYLQAGAQVNVLLNATTRLTVEAQRREAVSQQDWLDQRRVWGLDQGFAPWDAQLLLGYRYYLGRGLRLGLGGSYGLRDLTDDGFFRNQRDTRDWQVKVTVERHF